MNYSDIFKNIKYQVLLYHDALFVIHYRICLAIGLLWVVVSTLHEKQTYNDLSSVVLIRLSSEDYTSLI